MGMLELCAFSSGPRKEEEKKTGEVRGNFSTQRRRKRGKSFFFWEVCLFFFTVQAQSFLYGSSWSSSSQAREKKRPEPPSQKLPPRVTEMQTPNDPGVAEQKKAQA